MVAAMLLSKIAFQNYNSLEPKPFQINVVMADIFEYFFIFTQCICELNTRSDF